LRDFQVYRENVVGSDVEMVIAMKTFMDKKLQRRFWLLQNLQTHLRYACLN